MTRSKHNQTLKTVFLLLAVFMCFTEPNAVSSKSYASFSPATNSAMDYASPSISKHIPSEIPDNHVSQDDTTGIVCPDDISSYTDLNSCVALISAGLDLADPNGSIASLAWEMTGATEASSNSSGINQIGSYSFSKGTTVVTYSGATLYNNSINCTFTVTVSDNQVPRLISSPGHITVRNLPGECYANVSWTKPSAADNCVPQNQLIYTSNYNSGQQFQVGSTLVEYRISDGVNTAVHNFTVTVIDNEAPELIAPPDLESECGRPVPDAFTTWEQFEQAGGSANDNCSVNYGSFRYVGQTSSGITCPYTVIRTYSISDIHGNVSEVKHVIEVTGEGMAYEAKVESTEPEVLLEPGAETQAEILFAKTDVSCKGSRTGEVDLTVNGTSGIVSFVWSTQNGSGIVQGAEDQNTLSDGDYTVMVYEDGVRLLAFDFSILVSDDQAPVLNAPATIQRNCGQSVPAAYSTWSEFANAGGTVRDNCQIYYSSFRLASETQSDPDCPYTLTRIYEITDVNGNRGFAEHLIIVEEEEIILKSGQGTAATIVSTTTGGDWNATTTWVGGVVPTAGDDVEIVSGATVTINNNILCDNLLINGTLSFAGMSTLQISGNWTNNGTFTAGTGTVEFNTAGTNISGTSTTSFNILQIDAGADVNSVITVSSNLNIANLNLTNGLLSIVDGLTHLSGINTISQTAGIEVNGVNAELTTGDLSITNNGLIRIAAGIATFGNSSGNSVNTQVDGAFVVEGGEVNIAGRLHNSAGNSVPFLGTSYEVGLTVSGGTINLATKGNGFSDTGSLNITSYGNFNFSGGTITFQNPNSSSGIDVDLKLASESTNGKKIITNGIFQFGNSNTPIGSIFHIDSQIKIPNIDTYSGSALFLDMPLDGASMVECIDQATEPTPPVVIDNCGYEITPTGPVTGGNFNGCQGTRSYTYTYEDCDGSTHDWVYTYTILDVTNPTASGPTTVDLECADDLPAGATTIAGFLALAGADAADNCTVQGNLSVSFSDATTTGGSCNGVITRTYTIEDECGNTVAVDHVFTVTDNENPTASNPLPINIECAADVPAPDVTVVNDEADNCTTSPVVTFVSDVSDGGFNPEVITRTYSITDDCGNSINVEQIITVDDDTPPTPICQPLTIQLDATGNATITPDQIDNGSNDNCTAIGDLVFALDITDFDCYDVGDNTVTLTVTDEAGNSSTCTATVTVEDNVDPVAICQDITVQLDATGNATITAADIDNGSTDNCAITSRTLSQNIFDCDDVGENTVTLTITDVNGNSSTCDAKVTVEQIILPTALCKDITVELDASGNATITAGDIDNGSSVVCGTPTLSIDQSTFDCNDVGTQTVTLTVSDQNGNSSQCPATVTVQDNILPTVVCQDIIVVLDASGAANITAADIDNGSSDNCSIVSLVIDKTSFDCSEVGDHTVTLTVTDEHGNSNSCTANVEIIDNINPTAICRNITIQLNSSGTAVIAAADINNGSSDNCSIASVTINQTIFDCTHIGTNTVTLTVTDASGNSSTCEGTVTVEDNTNPIAICKNFTVQLDATGNASITAADIDNGSNDACGIASLDLDRYDFTCDDLGTNPVTLTVTDNNGNQSSCPAVVTVTDNLPPTASAGGSATICIDETHTVSGANANNGTIEWTHDGNGTLTGINSLTPGYTSVLADAGNTVTLTLRVTGNNACGNNTATASYSINVNPVATVNPIAPMEYCEGETTPAIALSSNLASVTFNIAGGQDIGLFNRNNVTEIPSFTAVAGTRTVTITPVYDGCPGESLDVVITVNPTPGVSAAPLFQTICSGEETAILLGSNLAGSTFYWTTTVSPAGSVSGMTDGVDESTTTIAQTLTNNITSEATVTYRIYAENGDCPGAAMDVIVKVEPGLTASIAGDATVCQEDPEPNITFTVNGGTAPYIFTYTINGGANQDVQLNSGNTIDVPVPTDTDGDFIYNLVSVYESGGCTHTFNETATVTVSPKPYLSSTLTPTGVCSNNAFIYTPTSDTPGTTFSWSRAAIAGIDNPAETGTDAIDEFLINTTNAPIPVVYTYTLEAVGCTNTQDVVVMVTPTPSLTSTLSPDGVCSESPFSYTPTSDVSETTFPWTRAAVAGISNPPASGTGDINEVLINTTDNPVAVTYEYTLTSNDCVNQATYSVVVVITPAPEVIASADVSCVCPGGTVNLTSSSDIIGTPLPGTLLAEDFNGSASGWTTTNTSTGGDPSNAAWTLMPEGYTYVSGWSGVTFSSNDNSQFYLSNSRDQGTSWWSNYYTRTTLESPAFSTVGYNSLELDFYHYYNDNGGDNANIEVSTDGANWTQIQRYDSDRGSSTNFRNETIDLTAYIGEPTLYIRFRYYATEDYFWAIDNVTVTGTSSGTTADVSWESFSEDFSSSFGEFSTIANPTNVTISEPTQFVVTYVDPETNCPGRYTVFVDICETPEPVIAPDYCAYEGRVLLTAYGGADGASYSWVDSNGDVVGTDQELIVDIVDVYTVTITNANGCSATTQLTVSNELIVNGDFEAGNTGFSSHYGFVEPYLNSPPSDAPSSGTPGSSLWPEGLYGVGTNARHYHTNFWGRQDHTSGSGNFMIVNGNVNAGTPIWEQTVNVQPNTNYYFSAWAMSLNSAGNDAVLQFEVNGVLVGSLARLNPGVGDNSNNGWVRFYSEPNWNSGSVSGPITVRIRNVEPAAGGNDFALDDISFGTFDPFPLEIDVDFDEVCEGDTLFLYSNSQYGKEPITYSWTGPNGWTSTEPNPFIPNFSLAKAGKYKLEALDGYGCEILPDSTIVHFNEAPVANAGPDDFVCTANPVVNLNGSIDGSAISGYWTGSGGTFTDVNALNATYTLSQAEIDAGIAELILSTDDPTGVCEAHKDTLYITVHNSLEITTSSTMPDCHGWATGTATATVSVPTVGPYTYLWSDGQTTAIARNLTAGDYSVTVTDANGCTAQATVTVNEPDLFVISAISPIIVAPSCYGANDGSATMEVTGGTPPYSFIWDAATGDQRTATASNLAAGTYTVLVTDANGCSAATFTAIIPNPPPPTLICPDDVEDFVDPVSCTITFNDIEDPLFDGYCTTTLTYELSGATTGSGTGSVNGIDFNVGLTTVKYKIEDTAGNKDSCTFTVFAKHLDLSPTVYTCPDPVVNAGAPDDYECFKNVTLGQVALDDDCNEIESIWHDSPYSSDPSDASGDYPVGTTNFTWYIRDVSGNIETCDVTVIVDDLDPQITCPADVSETVAANECSKTGVTIDPPTYNDNCPNPELSYVLSGATTGSGTNEVPSYQVFNIGVTTVTYTVTDANMNEAECSFTVTIERLSIPPAVITCPDSPDPVTAVAGTCFAPVNVDAPVINDPCTTTGYTVVNDFNNTSDASDTYPVGTTIVTWTITDNSGKTYECTQTVVVEDLDPVISCPSDVSETIAADGCSKSDVILDTPTYSDNCPDPVLTYTLSGATTGSGSDFVPANQVFNIGVTTVTYTVTDSNNNTAECSFTVTIERLSIPPAVVTCPDDPAPVTAVAGTCFAPVNVDAPVINDPCATTGYTVVNDFNNTGDASDTYPVGTTIVTWTITDNSGKTYECTQTVVVEDLDPVISCPSDVSETIAADGCSKSDVVIGTPTYSDNCPNPVLTYTLSGATTGSGTDFVPSNQVFNIGETTVTYTVTDSDGRSASCSFTVTIVRFSIPPAVVTCPDDPAPVTAVAGTCFAPVSPAPPVINDPCATTTYTIINDFTGTDDASGSYPVGTTSVTWTITDNSGKIYTCVQEVVVEDIPPTIDCPDNYNFLADENVDYKDNVTLDDPAYADNCPNPVVEWTRVEPDGTTTHSSSTGINFIPNPGRYYIGVTTITYKITDSSGLTDECSFTVTVTGIPEIDCPDDILQPTDAGVCTRALDPGVPVLEPGSPSADSWSWEMTGATTGSGSNTGSTPDPISPNPYTFNVGVTTITWTVCNISGCATCEQIITITDEEPPVITADPYENCVDPLHWATYNESNPNPVFNHVDPNMEKSPIDYRTFLAGDIDLDLTSLTDNCCDSLSMINNLQWRIEFADTPDPVTGTAVSHPDITGEGQPSEYTDPVSGIAADIYLWGDGVTFTTVTHSIFYWIEDCNGNPITEELRKDITITPRPQVIKMDY